MPTPYNKKLDEEIENRRFLRNLIKTALIWWGVLIAGFVWYGIEKGLWKD